MANVVYTIELTAYNIGGAATVTLYYADGNGFTTASTDTPASTFFDGRLLQPSAMKRDMFTAGATSGRSRIDFGSVELNNADGGLDALLTYGYGLAVVIRQGAAGAAYPASYTTVFSGTAQQPTVAGENLSISLRSLQLDLEQPFQLTKYNGDNALPDGLEGVATDLKGKPKPVLLGTVLNVSAPQVNTSKLIHQVSDGAIQSVDAVYDSGVNLTGGVRNLTSRTSPFAAGADDVNGIVYSPELGLFVAVGDTGLLATSSDGITWTSRTSSFSGTNISAVAWSATLGLFLAVGESSKAATSSDGITWTARTPGATYACVAAGLNLFVVGGNAGAMATTPDGVTWTGRTSSFGADVVTCLSFGNTGAGPRFVAGGSTSKLATSPDAVTWTQQTTPFTSSVSVQRLAFGNNTFIAASAGTSATNNIATSHDGGVSWVLRDSGQTTGIEEIAFTGDAFIVGSAGSGDKPVSESTPDGTDWRLLSNILYAVDAIGFGAGIIVIGTNAGLLYSSAGIATYASEADLLDDSLAPVAGSVKTYLAGGYIRLGSPPAGQVTCDASQGANAAARTAGQLFAAVMARAGISAGTARGNYLSADVTALDSANAAVLGDWISEEETYADVLDRIANSVGAWWGLDRQGRYRIQQFTAPSGSSTATITANDLYQPLQRVALQGDDSKGVPTWRSIVRYQKNYTVQTSGLAGAVTDARRGFLAKEWREAIDEDTAVQAAHVLAVESIYETLMNSASAAATEADRLQTLRGTLRHAYDAIVTLSQYPTVDLGDVVTLTHARYGLSAGVLHRVIGVETNARLDRVTLRLWR